MPLGATAFGIGPTARPPGIPQASTDVGTVAAPERKSALAGVSAPAPRRAISPLAGAPPAVPARAKGPSLLPAGERFEPIDSELPRPVGPVPTKAGSGAADAVDLPAPVGPTPTRGAPDLLAPVGPAPTRGMADLPAPVGPTPTRGISDLPAPVGPAPTRPPARPTGRPASPSAPPTPPAASFADLPAPKGFFDDLPGLPAAGPAATPDLPAPKGFFDDIPGLPAAGRTAAPDLPAPKGFFDDIPGLPAAGPAAAPDLPAPKGFFDDIPGLPAAASPPPGARDLSPKRTVAGLGAAAPPPAIDDDVGLDIDLGSAVKLPSGPSANPLELGTFDPIGGRAPHAPPTFDLPGSDAEPLELADADVMPLGGDLDELSLGGPLGAPGRDRGGPAAPVVPLELPSLPTGRGGGDDPFGGLELPDLGDNKPDLARPAPAAAKPGKPAAGGVVTFSKPTGAARSGPSAAPPIAPSAPARTPFSAPGAATEGDLELDTKGQSAKPAARGQMAGQAAEARARKGKSAAEKKSRGKVIALVALLLAAAGAGGFHLFSEWQEKREAKQNAQSAIASARKLLAEDTPGHWDRAAKQAEQALQIDPKSAEAHGLAGQAYYAALLDEGRDPEKRKAQGRKAITAMRNATARGPEADKAEALQSIAERRMPEAIKRLSSAVQLAPQDQVAKLYLGWAFAASHEHAKAEKAFSEVVKASPNRIPALYGLAEAQIATGKIKEARENLLKVSKLARDKLKYDHIGALVGIAQLSEEDRYGDRENRYLEITQREGLDKADPRAVSRAFSLAGDEALKAGRVDAAAQRYAAALERDRENLHAQVGEASVALRRGQPDVARNALKAVLALDPGNVAATVTMAEVALAEGSTDEALGLARDLIDRKPPVSSTDAVRAHMVIAAVRGGNPDGIADAEAEYRKAIELAGANEIGPRIGLVKLLSANGRADEALKELAPVREQAQSDPALAVTLGVAYLQAGEYAKAEEVFRAALAKRPGDVEATFQLAVALFALGKRDEGLSQLAGAYDANPGREDIGIRLGTMYEEVARDDDARKLYDKLLAVAEASIGAKERAGRFYARTGDLAKALALGDALRTAQPRNATGIYLLGEQLYSEGKFEEARAKFAEAVRLDANAQLYEALGRAGEQMQVYGDALADFGRAAELDTDYLAPRLGRARVHLAQGHYADALAELAAAQKIAPQSAEIYAGIGQCYSATNRFKEAAKAYEAAIRLDPKNAFSHYQLGMAYFDLDRAGQAAASLQRAVELADKTPIEEEWLPKALEHLGRAAQMSGQKSTAIEAYKRLLENVPDDSIEARDAKKELLRLGAH